MAKKLNKKPIIKTVKKVKFKLKPITKTQLKATGKIYCKEHVRSYLGYEPKIVVAMCDENLIGKIYADTKTEATLNLQVYRSFYEGKLLSIDEARSFIAKNANNKNASFNLIGQNAIKLASEFFNTSKAKRIGRALHLEIYCLK